MNRILRPRRLVGAAWQALAAVLLALPVALPVLAAPRAKAAHGLIVKLRDAPATDSPEAAGSRDRLERVLADAGIEAGRARPLGRQSQHLDFGRALAPQEAARLADRLRALPQVAWVVPNEREQRLQVPQDPLYASSFMNSGQWWLHPAGGSSASVVDDRRRGVPGLPAAWDLAAGAGAAVVAVLDSGIVAHPDLAGRVLPGRDFVSTVEYANDGDGWDADPSDPGDWVSTTDRLGDPMLFDGCEASDSSWHGTIVAGVLAAQADNGIGVAGVAWGSRVLPVRVAGKCGAEVADIVAGMRWAAGLQVHDRNGDPVPLNPNPARIVNVSFGGSAPCNAAYQEAIDDLRAVGAVVVAAAGNDSAGVARPASCAGVIGVAALNRDGFKSSYSSFGPQLAIATVGGDPRYVGGWGLALGDDGLLTIGNAGTREPGEPNYGRTVGTSFATPIVSGVAAVMLGVNPALTAQQIIDGLRSSARPHVVAQAMPVCSEAAPGRCLCTTSTCGAGILDAAQALRFAQNPDSYVPPARAAEPIDSAELEQAVALGPDLPPQGGSDDHHVAASGDDTEEGAGAFGPAWLLALAAALAALARPRRGVGRRH